MKYTSYLLVLLSGILACCKKAPEPPVDTCPGHFVGMEQVWKAFALSLYEIDSIYGGPNGSYFETSNYENGYEAYDSKQKLYYIFSRDNDSLNLLQYSFADDRTKTFRYLTSDSITPRNSDGLLFCDAAANKIYCFLRPLLFDSVERICEIAITDDHCTPRTVYYASPGAHITMPLVNEQNGCIYFINGSQFIKVDPITNLATTVTTFSKVRPSCLVFSKSDGLFYGIDRSSAPNNFIKVDPATGHVTIIAAMPYTDTSLAVSGTFDNCRNCYVAIDYTTKVVPEPNKVYFLDIKTGKKVKEKHKFAFGGRICIND